MGVQIFEEIGELRCDTLKSKLLRSFSYQCQIFQNICIHYKHDFLVHYRQWIMFNFFVSKTVLKPVLVSG